MITRKTTEGILRKMCYGRTDWPEFIGHNCKARFQYTGIWKINHSFYFTTRSLINLGRRMFTKIIHVFLKQLCYSSTASDIEVCQINVYPNPSTIIIHWEKKDIICRRVSRFFAVWFPQITQCFHWYCCSHWYTMMQPIFIKLTEEWKIIGS